jgi:hypothetical protein
MSVQVPGEPEKPVTFGDPVPRNCAVHICPDETESVRLGFAPDPLAVGADEYVKAPDVSPIQIAHAPPETVGVMDLFPDVVTGIVKMSMTPSLAELPNAVTRCVGVPNVDESELTPDCEATWTMTVLPTVAFDANDSEDPLASPPDDTLVCVNATGVA